MLGQKLGCQVKSQKKTCVHSRGDNVDPKFMKIRQNVNHLISRSSLKLGHVSSKLGCWIKLSKTIVYTLREHSFDKKFMKLRQNVNPHKI